MTASCPMCGGKWDIEDEHYEVILRCGDEHDIKCGYCKRVITFLMDREALDISYNINLSSYENMIVALEKKLLVSTQELEKSVEKRKGILEGKIK